MNRWKIHFPDITGNGYDGVIGGDLYNDGAPIILHQRFMVAMILMLKIMIFNPIQTMVHVFTHKTHLHLLRMIMLILY